MRVFQLPLIRIFQTWCDFYQSSFKLLQILIYNENASLCIDLCNSLDKFDTSQVSIVNMFITMDMNRYLTWFLLLIFLSWSFVHFAGVLSLPAEVPFIILFRRNFFVNEVVIIKIKTNKEIDEIFRLVAMVTIINLNVLHH